MRQDDEDDDATETGDRATMAVVPWADLRDLRPIEDEPAALVATWRGRAVLVVSAVTFRRWVADWKVAIVDEDRLLADGSPANVPVEPVELLETLRADHVVAKTVPDNALVVDNCRGVQVGDHNKQRNDHRFELKNVVVTLDRAFMDHLTSGRATTVSRAGRDVDTGRYRVIVKNSQGVQLGDHCTQRNRFVHRIDRPTVRLSDFCGPEQLRKVAAKVEDGKAALRAAVTSTVTAAPKINPDALYALTPRSCNVRAEPTPRGFEDTDGLQVGRANKQTDVEQVKISGLDVDDVVGNIEPPDDIGGLELSL